MYADPESVPLSSSLSAPTTILPDPTATEPKESAEVTPEAVIIPN